MRRVRLHHPTTGGTCEVPHSTARELRRSGWLPEHVQIAATEPVVDEPQPPSWLSWGPINLPDTGDEPTSLTEED